MDLDTLRNGRDFGPAIRRVAACRDELTIIWRRTRAPADRERLAQVNAVLSTVMAAQYPLGEIPWEQFEIARKQLIRVMAQSSIHDQADATQQRARSHEHQQQDSRDPDPG